MSWLHALRHRLRVRLRPDAYARERAEELAVHQAMEARDRSAPDAGTLRQAAAPPPAIPRDALSPDPSRHPDQEPPPMRLPLLDWLSQDLGYALRGIRRSPGFTAMVVVTLALGVGANAAVFSLLDRVFGQAPVGVSEPGQLRRLYVQFPDHPIQPGMVFPPWNYAAFAAVADAAGDVARLAVWTPSSETTLGLGDADLTARRSFVSHDFFEVLGVGPAWGRLFGADEERVDVPTPVAVISHTLWRQSFGLDPAVVGRHFEMGDRSYTIIGVAAEGFSGLDLSRTDVFLPVNTFTGQSPGAGVPFYQGTGNFFRTVARLAPGVDERVLAARATPARRAYGEALPQPRTSPADATALVLTGSIIEARGPAPREQILSVSTRAAGVTLIVLLIACANVAGLLLVRVTRRRREIAIRLALGVSRARLFCQVTVESLTLATLAGGAAVFVAVWGGGVLRRLLMPTVQWAQPSVEPRTVAFTLASAVAVGLLAGLAPGLQARRVDVNAGLKAGARDGVFQMSWGRSALLVAQAALSVVLLVGAGLFARSFTNVTGQSLGYDTGEIAWIRLPLSFAASGDAETMTTVAERIARVPGVSGVALATSAPMMGSTSTRLFLPGRDSLPRLRENDSGADFNQVTPDFFAVTGLGIVAGRVFTAGDPGRVALVNQTMANTYWPGESALGQCMMLGNPDGPCIEVVGITEDGRRSEIIEESTLQYFLPLADPERARAFVFRSGPAQWGAASAAVQEIVREHFDPRVVRVQRMSDALEPQLRPWRMGAQLFTAFGALALLVTLVGIYSVTSYTISQRTHEMGVRIALGARMGDVLRLVVAEGLRVVVIGVALGIALALALGSLVESLLFGVTARDPVAVAVAAAVLMAAGVIASLVPAWRAARVDPVRALAAE